LKNSKEDRAAGSNIAKLKSDRRQLKSQRT
jgi:hypothetical protein